MSDYEKNAYLYHTLHKYDNYKTDNTSYTGGEKIGVRLTRRKFFRTIKKIGWSCAHNQKVIAILHKEDNGCLKKRKVINVRF